MKKVFLLAFRVAISIGLLAFLFSKIDLGSILGVILSADIYYAILSVFSFFVIYVISFYRWKMLLDAQSVLLPLKRILSSFSGGLFFSLFLPSTIGGDIARSVDLGVHTRRRSVVIASVLLDRISGFVGLVIVAIFALMFGYRFVQEAMVYRVVLLLAVLLGAVLVVLFNKKIYARLSRTRKENAILSSLKRLHAEIYFFRSKPQILAFNLFLSIVIQAGSSLTAYFILRCIRVTINIAYPFILTPVITAITVLPISIGGLGLRDASSVFFYTKVGVAKDSAFAHSLLSFSLIVLFGLIGGIIYVSTLHYRRLQSHQANPGIK